MEIVNQKYNNFISYLACVSDVNDRQHVAKLTNLGVTSFLAGVRGKSVDEMKKIISDEGINIDKYNKQVQDKVTRYFEYFKEVNENI